MRPPPAASGPVARRLALAAGCLLGLAVNWNVTDVGSVAATVAAHYGVALPVVGLFPTVLFLGEMVTLIPGGRLIDGVGARRAGLLAAGVVVVAHAATLAAPSAAWAIGARALAGVGVGVAFAAGALYVRSVDPSPLWQGVYGGAALAGGGIALAVVPQLERVAGRRAPFSSAIAMAIVGAAVLAAAPETARAPVLARPALGRLLTDGRIVRLGIIHCAGFGLSVVLSSWVVTLLERHGGHGPATAGPVGGLILALGIVSRPAGGVAVRRWPGAARGIVAAALVVGAAGAALLTVATPCSSPSPAAS